MKITLDVDRKSLNNIFTSVLKDIIIEEMREYFYEYWLPRRIKKKKYQNYKYESYFLNKYMLSDMIQDKGMEFFYDYDKPRTDTYQKLFDDWAKRIPDCFKYS